MQSDPDWKGIMMWHSGISGLQFLLLILLSSVSIGTSDPDVKRSLLVADDLQNCPTQHCYQGSSHYRNEDLGNGNDLAARSEAQTSGQFLSADRRDNWQQFPKQSRAALFLRPTMPLKPQNFFKQSKLDAIASTPERVLQSFSASSIIRPSSSSSVFSRTSFPSSAPVYHVPVYFLDAASTKTRMPFLAPIYPPANSETSKLHGPQTSIHLDRAAPVGPLSPSTLLSQSGHSPSNAVLAVTPDILDNSKLAPSITMSGPVTEPPPIFLGNLPPDVPQLPLAPRILHTPNIASPLPPSFAVQPSPPLLHSTVPSFVCMQPAEDRHSATVSTSLQGGSADSASVTCRYPMHPYTSKQFISKLQLDPMPPIATSRFSVPPIFPPEVPIRSLISRASAVNVSFWVFPPRSSQQAPTYPRAPYVFSPPPRSVTTGRSPKFPLIQAVSSPYDSVKSETLLPPVQKDDSPERLHFEQFAPSLVPTQPLPVTAPPSIHSRDGKLHEPSSQSFQTPKSQRSVRFLPPSNAWPLVVFPPVTSDRKPLQGPSVHKIQAPEVSFLKDPPSLSPAQPLTIIAPPLVSPHRYQHPAMPDSSNSSTKQMPPRPFGASSHAWAPLTHSGTSGSPAGPVPSPINRPLESPSVASRATFTPLTIFPSHSHHPGAKGPAASPEGIACSEQPWKKPITLVATPPGKRPWGHVRVAPAPEIQGSVASPPNIAPSEHPQKKPSMPAATPPSNRSKSHAPIEISPMTQVPVFYSSITLPPEPQPGNSRTPALTPTMIFPSPSHCPGPVGLPPSVASSEPPLKKPRIPVAAPPRKTSQRSSTVGIPTMSQGPVPSPTNFPLQSPSGTSRIAFTPSMAFPSHLHHPGDKGIASSPSSVASSESPWNRPITPVATPRRKRSWRHVSVAAAPKNQGPVSSNFTPPSEPHGGSLRSPTSAPSRIFPSPPYHEHLKGPFASPPSINVPEPPQRTPEIPVAVPVHKRSRRHPPVAIPSMNPGPASSPANSVSSESPWNRPIVPVATPRRKRSRWHVPVAAAPKNQGPASSNFTPPSEPHKGSSRSPTSAPSRIFPSPPYHEHLKGPFASPPSINVSEPPQRTPEIPVAVPVHKRSRRHSPVAIPPMSQGSVSSPPITLPPTLPIGNSRNHVFAPPTVLPTPLRHAGVKGPVASPPSIAPSGLPQKKPRVPVVAPPSRRSRKHAPVAIPPRSQGSVSSPPITLPPKSPSGSSETPTFTPSITFPSPVHHQGPVASPSIAPSEPPQRQSGTPVPASPMIFPSPPPDQDCTTISCADPFTYSPPGSPCGCVIPMQVKLGLGVALYAFFPLVSELAAEVAAGTYLKQSQVRIMGANADNQDQEKTLVIIDLVPLGQIFDNTTALLIYKKFWQRKVIINETLFGDYRVIYVRYPGLPMPPPSAFSNASLNDSPVGSSNGPSKVEPFGANIRKRSDKMGSGTIAVIALSSAIAAVICLGAVWIILLKCSNQSRLPSTVEPTLASSITKRSGGASILSGSLASSASMSFASSMATYTGSAKTFTLAELEKATDRFNPENILGEGGFGRVYRGALEDGMKVAVKVLTRDDQQGGREFIAEVEMLSRLHHRNLVKLIGICTEEHNRSLVYELIPNGSVESHLHGLDKETAPLDWDARMKIALGAARGLAYLHEDSSPRVIHRDFKASNILLEDDFTPKVSDFGLAKAASEEGSGHISTRVMGTFGYVAPEYAMTGHLLVKSDVYSYGVVLLELLSGRKPVDMSQPPGQENLVTWARSLLTSKEGLETLKDPALGGNVPFDNMARVAAIASMCVQPEVSHRPFMGEVVQALKLVYNDSDASNGGGSGSCSQGGESSAHDNEVKDGYGQTWCPSTQYVPDSTSFVTIDYDSGPLPTQGLEAERPLSASALLSTSGRFVRQLSGSFRRHSSSGPLRTRRSKPSWYGVRGLARGSISEHHLSRHLGTGIDGDIHDLWP